MRAQSFFVETAGESIKRRREAIGYNQAPFAREAGISRTTLAAIEEGSSGRTKTMTSIARTLERLEAETGLDKAPADDAPTGRVVTFTLEGVFGIGRVSVAGPVEDAGELEQMFADLISKLRDGGGEAP